MKSVLIIIVATMSIVGCASRPMAMKTDNRYFTPVRSTSMASARAYGGASRATSLSSAQKKIYERETIIELLKKENRELRERIKRLEKKLKIQNS